MYLLAGSTGFLGNEILKVLGEKDISTIALARRTITNLP
jgi:NAD dependent epimerase/dehydratase family enzyme